MAELLRFPWVSDFSLHQNLLEWKVAPTQSPGAQPRPAPVQAEPENCLPRAFQLLLLVPLDKGCPSASVRDANSATGNPFLPLSWSFCGGRPEVLLGRN